ncbi:MAG: Holliday junction resolvase RuvX [Phycisphaeraceae bacterium]|nr:Holliday junction resolvase RuvX [Phycisphaeraceae bacterium]MCW5755398.1 Holliday junction resolvase RuvX [Phycisphaeraceae bacterium]
MRYLAIDLGERRTGLAVGDDFTRIATPLTVLDIARADDQGRALLRAVARAIEEHLGPLDTVLLGLPLNMDGSEGPAAKALRAWADLLRPLIGNRPILFHDERLTSADADWRMARSGLTHAQKKQRRDALAAAAILRDYLENSPRADDPPRS